MTKKIIFLTLVLVLGLSVGISASCTKTIAEKEWDNFFQTADLEYTANNGEYIATFGVNVPDPAYPTELDYVGAATSLTYSLTDNLEIYGGYTASTYDLNQQYPDDYYHYAVGSIKDKFLVAGPLTLAAKATVSYEKSPVYLNQLNSVNMNNNLTLNGKIYSNLSLGKYIKLYNNFSYTRYEYEFFPGFDSKLMANCVELNLNHNTLRVFAQTYLNDLNNLEPSYYAIFRSQPVKGITFISDASQSHGDYGKYFAINNILELKPLPSTVLTGQLRFAYPDVMQKTIAVDATQKLGFLTLKAGYEGALPNAAEQFGTLSGELKINFTKNFGLSFIGYQDLNGWGEDVFLQTKVDIDL